MLSGITKAKLLPLVVILMVPLGRARLSLSTAYFHSIPQNKDKSQELCIVNLHGGAFTMDDTSDLLMCERLLPLLEKELDSHQGKINGEGGVISIHNISYPLAPKAWETDTECGTYERVQRFIWGQTHITT